MAAVAYGMTAVVMFVIGAVFGWELHGLLRHAIAAVVFGGIAVGVVAVVIHYWAVGRRRFRG